MLVREDVCFLLIICLLLHLFHMMSCLVNTISLNSLWNLVCLYHRFCFFWKFSSQLTFLLNKIEKKFSKIKNKTHSFHPHRSVALTHQFFLIAPEGTLASPLRFEHHMPCHCYITPQMSLS